jgi:hypothetical protein
MKSTRSAMIWSEMEWSIAASRQRVRSSSDALPQRIEGFQPVTLY